MGKTIDGRYQIIKKIGEGGMGAVYLAEDLRLKRKVAIKRLLFQGKPANEEMFRKRFEREALAMAGFQHPNIVSVHDYGQDDEGVYLVIEYMSGGVLSHQMRKRRFTVEEAIEILLPLSAALQEIHGMGQVHRDIKPSNILFDKYGNPKLADFGVVKLLESESGNTLTATGAAVGTPAYMAPELIGGNASPATDQYALGVVLYELVTGKKPFKGRTPMETLLMQQTKPLLNPKSLNPNLLEWICDVLMTVLAKEPEERYSDMMQFAKVLSAGEPEKEGKTEIALAEPMAVSDFSASVLWEKTDEEETEDSSKLEPETASVPPILAEGEPERLKKKKSLPDWVLWAVIAVILVGLVIGFWGKIFGSEEGTSTQVAEKPVEEDVQRTNTTTAEPMVTETNTPTITYTPTISNTATNTPPPSPTPTIEVKTKIREKDGMEMVHISAGVFTMGNDSNLLERPAHEVYLDAYWIDKFEVTNAQYAQCVAGDDCSLPHINNAYELYELGEGVSYYNDDKYTEHPVINVDWYQAGEYCSWVNGSLPTEAQWEKAARGTDGRIYPWGDEEPNCTLANNHKNYSRCGGINAVGSYPSGASPYGVMDMVGNVSEWIADWYGDSYYDNSPSENPNGPSNGDYRVLRGGTNNSFLVSTRGLAHPTSITIGARIGFRCAMLVANP